MAFSLQVNCFLCFNCQRDLFRCDLLQASSLLPLFLSLLVHLRPAP